MVCTRGRWSASPPALSPALKAWAPQVMMLQLREETQPLASQMAVLLLRLYVLAVVPVTLWISLFMSVSGIV